ncbi:MAG: trypsin-like serine protease with C-terminal domain [Planctomycetota bacterium]|nr:trypsin-like serine protease with C-terminal domain [Planctomycetota bacterium]
MTTRGIVPIGLALCLAALAPDDPKKAKAPDVGTAYQVPYRLTLTNHYLVRVKINGKGPFNFLVDTGAPYLFVATEAAKKIGLEPAPKGEYWSKIDRLDLEGGATLKGLNGRVEDPFQLVGMNALGLPGASIDGILGFTILARFKMEFDPTKDRMTWTRLDFEPEDPFIPRNAEARQDPGVQAMSALGPIMKFASVFIGKQPEDVLHTQGLLGIELDDTMKVVAVLPDSPAATAGVQPGDRVTKIKDKSIAARKGAHDAIAKIRPGDRVALTLTRDGKAVEMTLTAAEGL